MNIAVIGPKKYDFQDLACVELMLRFHRLGDAQFFVEPPGGEDAELVMGSAYRNSVVEVQVKGAAGIVTLEHVAACLAHYPEREDSECLLERLLGDPERIAILIMTGRCNDAAAIYAVNNEWAGERRVATAIPRTAVHAMRQAFAMALPKGDSGDLMHRRRLNGEHIITTTNEVTLKSALSRVFVLEQITDHVLEVLCENRLVANHRVPSDCVKNVTHRLREIVKAKKGARIDVFADVREEIRQAAQVSVRPHGYVPRGAEDDWTQTLSQKGTLLLSGSPRVGKTVAAKFVASAFADLGYEIRECPDVNAAERFLLEPGTFLRLAILDDPLGAAHAVPESLRVLSRLNALIPKLPPGRKLVVAQAQDRLLDVARKRSLDAVQTGGFAWVDLGQASEAFLAALWRSIAAAESVPESLANLVGEALENQDLKLEPGCLRHLASHYDRLGDDPDLPSIARLAREDAETLGHALGEEGFGPLLRALAVGSSPVEPISVYELAFLAKSDRTKFPGKADDTGWAMVLGARKEPIKPPAYDELPSLQEGDIERLERLERRRMVEVGADVLVQTTHPFYRAVAESVVDDLTHGSTEAVMVAVERGLFCASPRTSRATARNLTWVYDRLNSRPETKTRLAELAVEGLQSYFPATRDLCLRFLVQNFTRLPETLRPSLPRWVDAVTAVSLDILQWADGEPYLPLGGTINSLDRLLWRTSTEAAVDLRAILEAEGRSYLSPEAAANALSDYRHFPEALSPRAVGRLLSYDEAVIRAEAAELWLANPRTDDGDVLRRIFADDHPSVGLGALYGAIQGWESWSAERRQTILDGLSEMSAASATAAALIRKLIVFGRVEHTGEKTPWPLFGALLPVVLDALPANAAFIEARLFAVVRNAIPHLPAHTVVDICDSWIAWLARVVAEGNLPDDYLLGVTDLLISATRAEPSLRDGRLEQLLTLPGTGAPLRVLCDLVDNWDALSTIERQAVETMIGNSRSDVCWLQAAVLTRENVPQSLQSAILGHGLSLDVGADELLEQMPPDLFGHAVHLYTGRPGVFSYLSTHHKGAHVWEPVIDLLAADPSHPLFTLAWDHLGFFGNDAQLASLVSKVGPRHAGSVFERLLLLTRHNFYPQAWAALLSIVPDAETQGHWISRMLEFAPAILSGLHEMDEWLSGEARAAMMEALIGDVTPFMLIRRLLESPELLKDSEIMRGVETILLGLCERGQPRLLDTCDWIGDQIKALRLQSPLLLQAIADRRNAILAEMKRIRDLESIDSHLPHWNGP